MAIEYGIEYLRKKLNSHKVSVDIRYSNYDMHRVEKDIGVTIPSHLKALYRSTLGWCAKAVDSIADRLIFREFEDSKDIFNLNDIFKLNNPDILFDSAILSALIASCCFIYITKDERGNPRLQVIEASNATGIIDPITGLLKEGYAVLERDRGKPKMEAHFLPFKTIIYRDNQIDDTYKHSSAHPLLVPIIYRPDAVRPFGRSRISRAAMYLQKSAKRTLERADITAEFYSFPQKYIVGMESDAESFDTWKATITSMLRIDQDSDGNKPTLGQFSAHSMSPFIEQLRMTANLFAGETGLTIDDLGFVSDNPSSSEAIKASHENLRLMVRSAQRCFSIGFLNVAYLSCCVRDNKDYARDVFCDVKVKWEPIFEPDASTLSVVGDGVIKLNQAVPGYITSETLRDLTGIKGGSEINLLNVENNSFKLQERDKQKSRIISTYEITSLLSNYQKGVLSRENGIKLLVSMGYEEQEATEMLENTSII